MPDFSTYLEKLKPLPWRLGLIVFATSFIAASVVSLFIGISMMPSDSGKLLVMSAAGAKGAQEIVLGAGVIDKASLDLILTRNIFNFEGDKDDASRRPGAPSSPTAEAVKTDLPVKLQGVIYGGDPFSGIAVVENTAKRSINSFMVGDQLDKDVVVKEILEERIIIDRSGRKEFVPLEEQKLMRSQRKRTKAKPAADSGDPANRPLATEPPLENYKEEGFERKGGDIEISAGKKNVMLTQELSTVLQDAKAEPNIVDGQVQGFRLERIRKGSIYEKSGFQNGDVIKEINGVSLSDAAQAIKLLQQVKNEPEIEIQYERGGGKRTTNIKVR